MRQEILQGVEGRLPWPQMVNTKSFITSYSAKYLYEWCPRQFKYVKIDRFKPDKPKLAATVVGSALHRAIELMYLNQKFTVDYLFRVWPSVLEETCRKERFVFTQKLKKEHWLNVGYKVLKQFYGVAQVKGLLIKAVATEWKFTLVVTSKSGRKYTIRGKVDLIIQVGNEVCIIDYKSGKYQHTQKEVDEHDQFTIYSLAFRRLLGKTETKLGLFALRYDEILWTTRTEADYERVIEEIDQDQQKIEQKKFEPTYVKCYLCQFQARCKADDSVAKTGVPFEWFYREPKR